MSLRERLRSGGKRDFLLGNQMVRNPIHILRTERTREWMREEERSKLNEFNESKRKIVDTYWRKIGEEKVCVNKWGERRRRGRRISWINSGRKKKLGGWREGKGSKWKESRIRTRTNGRMKTEKLVKKNIKGSSEET